MTDLLKNKNLSLRLLKHFFKEYYDRFEAFHRCLLLKETIQIQLPSTLRSTRDLLHPN